MNTILKLTNVSQIVKREDSLLLVEDEIFEIPLINPRLVEVFDKLKTGITENEIFQIIGIDYGKELIKVLKKNNLVAIKSHNPYENTMLEKQWLYLEGLNCGLASELQYSISTKTVCIVGVGGVGTVVLEQLVRCGLRSIIVVDFDIVSSSNLNRQVLFCKKDVGKRKIDVLINKVKEIDPDVSVVGLNSKIQTLSDLNILDDYHIDLLVNAADTPTNIEDLVYTYAFNKAVACISCSVGRNMGTWGPLLVPKMTMCYKCYKEREYCKMSEIERFLCKEVSISSSPLDVSFCPINSIVSIFMAKDIILFLAIGADKKLIHSLNTKCGINFSNLKISRDRYEVKMCNCWR